MFATLGMTLAASMGVAPPPPASIRIDLVAVVPVTCSSGAVLQSAPTANGIALTIAGSCNANHLVRVTLPDDAAGTASATLNGAPGEIEAGSFVFRRPAYFSQASTLQILGGGNQAGAPLPASLVIEISPV